MPAPTPEPGSVGRPEGASPWSPWPPAWRPAAVAPQGDGRPRTARPAQAKSKPRGRARGSKTAGIRVVQPERRDIRMTVVQPGTIQAFEVTPIYSRIAGYVDKYRYNIGDRVKAGDVLLDMWIPDIVEQHGQKAAAVEARRGPDPRRRERRAGGRRQAGDDQGPRSSRPRPASSGPRPATRRWESEYKRLQTLVDQQVLDVQVRDETYRQFEEAAAARRPGQRDGLRGQLRAGPGRRPTSNGPSVDVEAARADLEVAQAEERRGPGPGRVRPDQGPLRRRDHPAQRQPRRLPPARRRHQGRRSSSSSRSTRSASSSASPSWPRTSSTSRTRP